MYIVNVLIGHFFQIKEGAENLRKVAKDKKSVSDVNAIVKKSNSKLTELQQVDESKNLFFLVTETHDK
jgi:protein kinase N